MKLAADRYLKESHVGAARLAWLYLMASAQTVKVPVAREMLELA
jgi:hypothetical protein